MKGFHLEQNEVVNERYAVIYAPGTKRKRFPENCVYVKDSEQEARAAPPPCLRHLSNNKPIFCRRSMTHPMAEPISQARPHLRLGEGPSAG